MRTPLFKITGCAQVGLSATEYLRSGSNPFALFLATISSALLVRKKSTEPASTIAALSAWRPSEVHRVDRKSTRLNSSHGYISYAVFCLKKKKNDKSTSLIRRA